MKLTKDEVIEKGKKIMNDINFSFDIEKEITARFDAGEYMMIGVNSWLVSFPYGYEDFGRFAYKHLILLDDTGIGAEISTKNGTFKLAYNSDINTYTLVDKID